ncbi:ArsR family transcriptional regulator [Candidatus Woesearchaeota archaeon]|nr:ArsR family transcriptional regulator [Candidatus Woesearchaeota archaeon]
MYIQRITIINITKPAEKNINRELQWLATSLGLFNMRDKDRSLFRIFIELLKASKASKPLSSDELAFNLHLTRGTVIHHVNKLMESGIAIHFKNRYMLRVSSLHELIEEMEKDMARACQNLKDVAKEIDGKMRA